MRRKEGNRQGPRRHPCAKACAQGLEWHPSSHSGPSRVVRRKQRLGSTHTLALSDITNTCWSWGQLRSPQSIFGPLGVMVDYTRRWCGESGNRTEDRLVCTWPCASQLYSSALVTVLSGPPLWCPFYFYFFIFQFILFHFT